MVATFASAASGPASATRSALLAPRLALAACVRGYVARSTLGATLRPEQRDNHFPATPLCSLCWIFQGESRLLRRGEQACDEAIAPISVLGPHTQPVLTHNPGPVETLIVSLTPQAMAALTGIGMDALVNRVLPLDQVLDAAWQTMAQAVFAAPDTPSRIELVENFLEPRWQALAPDTVSTAARYRFWAENLALRAAQTGWGNSLRQAERRIKQWAGLPMRDLRRMVRAENSFFQVREAHSLGAVDWADAAADAGFSDQAHMCREVRRISGLSPAALLKAIEEDESFWLYRLTDA